MAGTTTTTFTGGLKQLYANQIESQINEDVVFKDALDETNQGLELGGLGFIFPVHTGRGGAVGSIAEGATTPTVSNQSLVKGTATATELVATIQLTSRALWASKGNKKAFVDALDFESKKAASELSRSFNRQLYGNKVGTTTWTSGKLGLASGAMSGAVLSFDNGNANHFYANQKLLIDTDARTVVSVDSSTTLTLSSTATVSDNDVISVGDASYGSLGYEMTGLDAIAQSHDDDLYGIDTGANPSWRALVLAGSGGANRPMARELMDALGDGLKDTGGGAPDMILAHSSAVREIAKCLENDVRFMPLQLKGGYKRSALTWNVNNTDVPIVSDSQCPLNKVYAINRKKLQIGYQMPWRWYDDDGATLSRVSATTTFVGAYGCMPELICLQRNSVGVLKDITINTALLSFGQT